MRADELSRAIEKELEEYLHQTTETVVEAVDAVTDEAIATLKSTSPKRSGRYVSCLLYTSPSPRDRG